MKVILDTNVIFSAFATRGLAQAVFELCLGRYTIVISEHILSELSSHLHKKLKMPDQKVKLIIDYLREYCLLGEEAPVRKIDCRDEEDIPILGLAEKAHPACIITGDEDLLVLKKHRSVPILSPREFWEKEKKRRR